MADQSAPPAGTQRVFSDPITLDTPIVRGEQSIDAITLRKPRSGELRGLNLKSLCTADVSAVLNLLPRISEPPITQAEADQLEPIDLAACTGVVIDFFMTSEDRARTEELLKA